MNPRNVLDANPALLMIKPHFESKGPPIVAKDNPFNDKSSFQKESNEKSFL